MAQLVAMESKAKELEPKADSTMLSEKELKRRLRASLRETGMVQHMTAQVRMLVHGVARRVCV